MVGSGSSLMAKMRDLAAGGRKGRKTVDGERAFGPERGRARGPRAAGRKDRPSPCGRQMVTQV